MTAQLAICSPCLMNPVLHTLTYEHLPVGLKSPPVPRKWFNFFFFFFMDFCHGTVIGAHYMLAIPQPLTCVQRGARAGSRAPHARHLAGESVITSLSAQHRDEHLLTPQTWLRRPAVVLWALLAGTACCQATG